MGEPTKTCPSCGAQVLAPARICKHCRHRFAGAGETEEPHPGTLTAPTHPTRRPIPLIAWLAGAVVLIGIAAAITLSSGGSSSSAPSRDGSGSQRVRVITGSEVDAKLNDALASQTSDAVSDVSCPGHDLYDGDTVDCDVTFDSGRTKGIIVTVTGTAEDPGLDIGLR